MIIGITGKKNSGKDTLFNSVLSLCHEKKYTPPIRLAFADPVKRMAALIYDVPEYYFHDVSKKNSDWVHPLYNITIREMAQRVGTEMFRKGVHPDYWIYQADKVIKKTPSHINIIITDVRFDNEVEYILNNKGIIIEMYRPDLVSNDTHESENGINPHYPKYQFINSSVDVVKKFYAHEMLTLLGYE